jgi:hypothetical protein
MFLDKKKFFYFPFPALNIIAHIQKKICPENLLFFFGIFITVLNSPCKGTVIKVFRKFWVGCSWGWLQTVQRGMHLQFFQDFKQLFEQSWQPLDHFRFFQQVTNLTKTIESAQIKKSYDIKRKSIRLTFY